jgi:hypothetical protein
VRWRHRVHRVRSRFELLLRGRGPFAAGRGRVPLRWLVLALLGGGGLYGCALGSFGLRTEQMAYSAIKVPLLVAVSTLICVPSFYALNAVLGLRDDFANALRAILGSQGVFALALASMAPWPLVAYLSSDDYVFATLFNGVPFLFAALAAQHTLARQYRDLIRRDARHRICRNFWLGLYVFVSVQFAWVLRPFVGDPASPTEFFREDAWSNALVVIGRSLLRLAN